MTKPEYALSYHACSREEIDQFIRSRGLDIVPHLKWLKTWQKIHMLRESDYTATFRFLDLPAEMRNAVYSEALALRLKQGHVSQKHSTSQILATCKQVHQEARYLLYENNQINLTLRLEELPCDNEPGWYTYNVGVTLNGHDVSNAAKSPVMRFHWPAFLEEVRSLKLYVETNEPLLGPPWYLERSRKNHVNHVLHDLQSFLRKRSSLRELQVQIGSKLIMTNDRHKRMLFSLCLLGARAVNTTFMALQLPLAVLAYIESNTDLLRKIRDLEAKTERYLTGSQMPRSTEANHLAALARSKNARTVVLRNKNFVLQDASGTDLREAARLLEECSSELSEDEELGGVILEWFGTCEIRC